MFIEKWQPLKELENMRREMDRILEEIIPTHLRHSGEDWKRDAEKRNATPAIDIIEKNGDTVIKAELPGVAKEDISIALQEDILSIRGEIKGEPDVKDEQYTYRERNYKAYSRSIKIPFKVNQEKIAASLKDGILTVTLPKAEDLKPKKIAINIG